MNRLVEWCGTLSLAFASIPMPAHAADAIPYPAAGTYNPVTYSFVAPSSGNVVAYFVGGSGAGNDNELGLLINGVSTGVSCLNNHSSAVGDSCVLGAAAATNLLTFVLHDLTQGKDAFSDPALNVGYDAPGVTAHNHFYSTAYTATTPLFAGVPPGIYGAFEDLPFPGADLNYNDLGFVVTNASLVPEPGTVAMMLAGLALLGGAARRRR